MAKRDSVSGDSGSTERGEPAVGRGRAKRKKSQTERSSSSESNAGARGKRRSGNPERSGEKAEPGASVASGVDHPGQVDSEDADEVGRGSTMDADAQDADRDRHRHVPRAGAAANSDSASDEDDEDDEEDSQPTQSLGGRILDFVRERYLGVDPRWLGVHRICLGILLMVEVLRRMYYARAFYTNDGILPNHFSLFRPMGRNVFSIYHAFSTYGEVMVAFSATLIIFFLFTIGYKTKLFHILSAICIVSLNNRNIFVENGGTVVVNIMTVYSVFLPMGQRFSVDAVQKSLRLKQDRSALDLNLSPDPYRSSARIYSLTMLLFILQWAAIYFFNTVHKDGIGWRNGSALHFFFWQDRIVTDLGIWVREHVGPAPLRAMTYGALVAEGSLAALILIPFWQVWVRRLILVLVLALHGGIALSARIGPFSYVMSLFPILLLGARDFEIVSRWFSKTKRARTVIFQSDVGLCFQVCRVLDRLDPFERLTFVDAREVKKLPKRYDAKAGLVVFDPTTKKLYTKERALSEALAVLPFGRLYFYLPRLPVISHFARQALGAKRARRRASEFWGTDSVPLEPASAPHQPERFLEHQGSLAQEFRRFGWGLKELAVAFLLVAWGMAVLHDNRYASQFYKVKRPEWAVKLMEYPRLLQGWGMFAPEPPFEDGRVVVDGRTEDGRKLDPLTGLEPEFDPQTETGWGHEQFWCDYHNRIRYSGHAPNRQHLRQYLLNHHKFSGRPEDKLVAFDVWWIQDQSPMPGEKQGKPLKPLKLTSHGNVRDSGATPWLKYPAERPMEWN